MRGMAKPTSHEIACESPMRSPVEEFRLLVNKPAKVETLVKLLIALGTALVVESGVKTIKVCEACEERVHQVS